MTFGSLKRVCGSPLEVWIWILTLGFVFVFPFGLALLVPFYMIPYFQYVVAGLMSYVILQQILEAGITLFVSDPEYTPSRNRRSITVLLPMYLPNEQSILFNTLQHYKGIVDSYWGTMNVILAYNTPVRMRLVEDRIEKYYLQNSEWFSHQRVEGSRTKAENLNWVINNAKDRIGEILAIYDADHRPLFTNFDRVNYWFDRPEVDYVQGKCKIRSDGSLWDSIVGLNFNMMYDVAHRFRTNFYKLSLFGGSNGFWRFESVKKHGLIFDPKMLTEDIDFASQAMNKGCKGVYDNEIISTEEAPPSFMDFFVQRTRWAQGWFEVSIKHFSEFFTLPNYTPFQRFGLVNLFIIRELLCHIKLLTIPLMTSLLVQKGEVFFDPFGTFMIVWSIFPYFLQLLSGYVVAKDDYWDSKWKLVLILFFMIFYNLIESVLIMRAQIRHLFKLNRWITTPRKTVSV